MGGDFALPLNPVKEQRIFCGVFSQGEAAELLRGQWGRQGAAGGGMGTELPCTTIPSALLPNSQLWKQKGQLVCLTLRSLR